MTNDYVTRIYTKLENYRQACGFFLKFAVSMYSNIKADRDYVLDDLHVFLYYLMKFSHNKFSFLMECLNKQECPKKLLKPVEADYWSQFLKSDKNNYSQLKNDTATGRSIIEKLFTEFRGRQLKSYLERSGRSVQELDTIYNARLDIDCTASFKGKLIEAMYILQKISQTKKDNIPEEISKILLDLEFGQFVGENMDDYKSLIEFDAYKKDRDSRAPHQNVNKYLKVRSW